MRSQRIMWTVLPHPAAAVTDTVLRLSVVVSPRLRTDEQLPRPTLQLFPDFVDWPATLQGVTWVVHIDDAEHVAEPVVAARSDLWTELFVATTFVRPEVFTDLSGERVHSYPAAAVASFLLDRYAAVAATSPIEYPTVDWLRGPDGSGRSRLIQTRSRRPRRRSRGCSTRTRPCRRGRPTRRSTSTSSPAS